MSEASRTRDKCKGSVYPAARRIGDRMCASFTDDEGKRVVNANGEEIGIVQNISGGTAHVDLSPGITDTIKSKLGWVTTTQRPIRSRRTASSRSPTTKSESNSSERTRISFFEETRHVRIAERRPPGYRITLSRFRARMSRQASASSSNRSNTVSCGIS